MESTAVVHASLRQGVRDLERLLLLAAADGGAGAGTRAELGVLGDVGGFGAWAGGAGAGGSGAGAAGSWGQSSVALPPHPLTLQEQGQLLALLHRMHHVLVFNSSHFDEATLRQLQEDLRDLVLRRLTAVQRLAIVHRIIRHHPFLQARQRSMLSLQ